jgi:hypothetical protein
MLVSLTVGAQDNNHATENAYTKEDTLYQQLQEQQRSIDTNTAAQDSADIRFVLETIQYYIDLMKEEED